MACTPGTVCDAPAAQQIAYTAHSRDQPFDLLLPNLQLTTTNLLPNFFLGGGLYTSVHYTIARWLWATPYDCDCRPSSLLPLLYHSSFCTSASCLICYLLTLLLGHKSVVLLQPRPGHQPDLLSQQHKLWLKYHTGRS